MRDFRKEDSKYKIVAKLSIISVTTLLMMFAGTASIDSHYHSVYAAAKNATSSSSSSTSKGGGSSSSNSTSPIGSSTFLNVITKVVNSKGGTAKPSDFTITVSGKSPSPKSSPGSSGGTSVTLKAGKYKVIGSGPSGYNIAYSSGCSGTASGGVPIKCAVSPSFSKAISGNNTSPTTSAPQQITLTIKGFIKRSECSNSPPSSCPNIQHHTVKVEWLVTYPGGKTYIDKPDENFIPTNQGTTISRTIHTSGEYGYRITTNCQPNQYFSCSNQVGFRYQSAYIYGGTGTCTSTGGGPGPLSVDSCESRPVHASVQQTVNINYHWECLRSFC